MIIIPTLEEEEIIIQSNSESKQILGQSQLGAILCRFIVTASVLAKHHPCRQVRPGYRTIQQQQKTIIYNISIDYELWNQKQQSTENRI